MGALPLRHVGIMQLQLPGARGAAVEFGYLRHIVKMQIVVLLTPIGTARAGKYACSSIPRQGDVLDLSEANPTGNRIPELESELMVVVQVIHSLGPEAENHRVTVRVVPLLSLPSRETAIPIGEFDFREGDVIRRSW
jgi:hypothetical protein